ncbi:MAG: hypothetical protein ABSD44_03925 [Terracidiphilus sp.]
MLKTRLAVLSLGIAMLLPTSLALLAEKPNESPAAPLPSQILTAKKVFIANGGGGFDKEMWSGEPSRTYNEFYGAIKAWGHYDLVGTPAEADLVLQISITSSARILGQAVVPWFQVRLALLDPKTNTLLWALDEFIPEKPGLGMMFKGKRDKEFDDGVDRIVGSLKALTALPAADAK